MHDGKVAFPHAIAALNALRNKQLDICLLSNSTQGARNCLRRLA
ncbi:hypothetical protein [Mesorhizobium shangrilense]|uniref:Uncharacterized protein n=1 Tax=Mesorhizobium shangrilense TaxID=460060 RepID=A0ABV2DSF6_9HYPH